MAISRPATKTKISTTEWGWPITDEVNALRTASDARVPTPWANVVYQNGWTDYGTGFQPVQYRKVGDIVYMRGICKGGASSTVVCNIPAGFRPPLTLTIPILSNALLGYASIAFDGNLTVVGSSVNAWLTLLWSIT